MVLRGGDAVSKVCVRTVLSRHRRCAQRHSWTQTTGTDDVPDINTLSEVPTRLALHGDTLDSGRLTSERAGWLAALRARITSKVPQPGVASCCSPKRLISAPRGVSFSVSPVVGEMGVERNDGAEYLSSRNTMPRWLVSLRDGQPSVGWVFLNLARGRSSLPSPQNSGVAPEDGTIPRMEARGHQKMRLGIKFAMFRILNGSSEIYIGGWAGYPEDSKSPCSFVSGVAGQRPCAPR